jgi:hypothetical protein
MLCNSVNKTVLKNTTLMIVTVCGNLMFLQSFDKASLFGTAFRLVPATAKILAILRFSMLSSALLRTSMTVQSNKPWSLPHHLFHFTVLLIPHWILPNSRKCYYTDCGVTSSVQIN